MRRIGLLLMVVLGSAVVSRGNEAELLARIHVEAIGGKGRLDSLQSLRVKGHVDIDERRLYFTLVAQRPNRVRMETRSSDRVLIQASDGVNPPWQMDPEAKVQAPTLLPYDEAVEFAADSEFDDPLVDFASKGYTLDYAGKVEWQGRTTHRIFVTRRHVSGFYLLLDAETYFITGKQKVRKTEFGQELRIVTTYSDFRPVSGVIMPHRFTVEADGSRMHETVLRKVHPNVEIAPGIFSIPEVKVDKP